MSDTVRDSLRSAARGTAFVLTGMAVSQALWFATRLLIVRNLSKEDLGIFSLAVGVVSIVSIVASVGLWEGASRYISIFAGQGRKEDADSVHRSSLRIGTITGAGTCAALFLLSGVLSRYVFYKPEFSSPLMVIAFFVPAYVLSYILASVMRGYGDIRPKVYFMDIGQPFFFFVLLCLILLAGLSFISIIYAYVFSMMAACVLIALYSHRKTKTSAVAMRGTVGHTGELLRFSVWVLLIDVMFLILRWADTLMLGRYSSAEDVGRYSVSVSLAAFLTIPIGALESVYMPIAGDLFAKNRSLDLARTYQVLTKWVFSATLPIFFVLFFFPEITITFLFGERFADSSLSLRILSLGYLFNAFMGTCSMLLYVIGQSRAAMKVYAAGTLLNLASNYILIKHVGLGITGAAISSMVSFVMVSSGCLFVLYRQTGIHPLATTCLKPAAASTVIGVLIYAAAKSLPLYFWMLPIYLILYVCGYVMSLFLTRSLDAEDVFLFEKILKKAGVESESIRKITQRISEKGMDKGERR